MEPAIAVLDACVLYPAPLRDLLIQLAVQGLYRAKWTQAIHAEWITNLLEARPDLTCERLQRTQKLMNQAVPECLVEGYETHISSLTLPDADDRHVLAAAITAEASWIVTSNLKDFPEDALKPYGIQAIHPDDFVQVLIQKHEDSVVTAARACRARLQNPPKSADEYLSRLASQGLTQTVAYLRNHEDQL